MAARVWCPDCTPRDVHIERVNSAYRLGVCIALVYALWKFGPTLWPYVANYGHVVADGARASRAAAAPQQQIQPQPNKLSAPKLEAMLLESRQFPPDSRPQCYPVPVNWDYVCSYTPKASQSTRRLQFGVKVDATRWVKVSSIVPVGSPVPASK